LKYWRRKPHDLPNKRVSYCEDCLPFGE